VSYVDETGKLVYQELKESSGVPELDAGALNAVRTAAPYPAVPFGHPHVTVFSFGAR
jgi:periplasmic protein TonB